MLTPVFGGTGAPIGMFLITGNALNDALLKVASNLPTLIGPPTVTPFLRKLMAEDGCAHRDPWNVWALFVKMIPVVLGASAAIVSIDRLLLAPCQFEKSQGG